MPSPGQPSSEDPRPRITRRSLLSWLTVGATGVVVTRGNVGASAPQGLRSPGSSRELAMRPLLVTTPIIGAWALTVVRPDDQLRVTFEFVNLEVNGDELVAIDGAEPSQVHIRMGSQALTEEVINDLDPTPTVGVRHHAAGETRIVYDVTPPQPYTLAWLLDTAARLPVLDDRAKWITPDPAAYPNKSKPAPGVTALELPEGLWTSPDALGRFAADGDADTRGDVTALWRIRMGSATFPGNEFLDTPEASPALRVLWTQGYIWGNAASAGSDSFPRALDARDRADLVRATAEHSDTTLYPNHEAARVRRLWLTSQGGFLDVEGGWSGGTGSLTGWSHLLATGRDARVSITRIGFLAPFGTPANVVTITEREFRQAAGGTHAVLVQREFLQVTTPTLEAPSDIAPDAGRGDPFVRTTVPTTQLVEITRGELTLDDGTTPPDTDQAFVALDPVGTPLQLPLLVTDRSGQDLTFTLTPVFVDAEVAFDTGAGDVPAHVRAWFADSSSAATRDSDLGFQPLSFTDEVDAGSGRTTRQCERLRLTALAPTVNATALRAANRPAFLAAMERAWIRDDTIDQLSGGTGTTFEVTLSPTWLADGNGASNAGHTFAELVSPFAIDFGGDGSGAIAPSISTQFLGQQLGPSSTPPAPGGSWDPLDALDGAGKLLGAVSLPQIIAIVTNVGSDLAGDIRLPRYDVDLSGDAACYSFRFAPTLKPLTIAGTDVFSPNAEATALIEAVVCVPFDGSPPVREASARVTDVTIVFPPSIPAVSVVIDEFAFLVPPDGDPETVLKIGDVSFLGALNFLQVVQSFFSAGSGPAIVPDATGVSAVIDLPLPNVSFGIISLRDLRAITALHIATNGDPSELSLSLGTFTDPFSLTLFGFGGSGSFELTVAPHPVGFVSLKLSLAVTFEITIDIVVAKGSLSASIGAFLELESGEVTNPVTGDTEPTTDVTLGAFIDVVGQVTVFGLITITLEVLLTLLYKVNDQILTGSATVTVEVDIGIATKQASITAGGGPPSFRQ